MFVTRDFIPGTGPPPTFRTNFAFTQKRSAVKRVRSFERLTPNPSLQAERGVSVRFQTGISFMKRNARAGDRRSQFCNRKFDGCNCKVFLGYRKVYLRHREVYFRHRKV